MAARPVNPLSTSVQYSFRPGGCAPPDPMTESANAGLGVAQFEPRAYSTTSTRTSAFKVSVPPPRQIVPEVGVASM